MQTKPLFKKKTIRESILENYVIKTIDTNKAIVYFSLLSLSISQKFIKLEDLVFDTVASHCLAFINSSIINSSTILEYLIQVSLQLDLNLHRLSQQRKSAAQPVHFLAKFKKLPTDMQNQLCGETISENYKHNPVSDPGDPQL